jgi:hypothetical protein
MARKCHLHVGKWEILSVSPSKESKFARQMFIRSVEECVAISFSGGLPGPTQSQGAVNEG